MHVFTHQASAQHPQLIHYSSTTSSLQLQNADECVCVRVWTKIPCFFNSAADQQRRSEGKTEEEVKAKGGDKKTNPQG